MSSKTVLLILLAVSATTYCANPTNQTHQLLDYELVKSVIAEKVGQIDLNTLALMYDATTSSVDGVLNGNLYHLGDFEECYNIHDSNDIYGKYCLGSKPFKAYQLEDVNVTVSFFNPFPFKSGVYLTINVIVGLCIPSTLDVEIFNKLELFGYYTESLCYSKDTQPKLSNGGIATICVVAIVLGLAVVSTVYDIFLNYKEEKPVHEILLAFSCLSNGRKLVAYSTNPDQILCLNGIKAISMMWVVLGHAFSNSQSAPLTNLLDTLLTWSGEFRNWYVLGASVSVDTFFLVGGLVTVYTYLKATDKGVEFNIFLYYIHRYLRLTPAFGIIILFHANLFEYFSVGPVWNNLKPMFTACQTEWWKSLLYINTFALNDTKGLCVPQSWYLDNDMQLFILSPLILIPLAKNPKITLNVLKFLVLLGCIIPASIIYGKKLTNGHPDLMKEYYLQSYARFAPYIIGMLAGHAIYNIKKDKKDLKLPWFSSLGLWIVCLTAMVACVYSGYYLNKSDDPLLANTFYCGLNRQGWSLAVAGVILLCVTGNGKPVDKFLSLHVFQIITKLSYSIYLIHYAVITIRYFSMKYPFKFTTLTIWHMFWGDFAFSTFLAVFLCLLFESPVIILEKYIFGHPAKKVI